MFAENLQSLLTGFFFLGIEPASKKDDWDGKQW
jgi:hypothetical protein